MASPLSSTFLSDTKIPRARRERLLEHLRSTEHVKPLALAK
jgi:hypothetical protein